MHTAYGMYPAALPCLRLYYYCSKYIVTVINQPARLRLAIYTYSFLIMTVRAAWTCHSLGSFAKSHTLKGDFASRAP